MKTTLSIRALLSSALIAAPVAILAPAIASADDGNKQWYSHGDIEVGTNIFIDEPSSGFGLVPGTNLFLMPSNSESDAKLHEYGQYPDVFSTLHLWGGRTDDTFFYDFLAEDIGNNSQHYSLDLQKTGRHYLELDWDEIPHLLTTSAKNVFGGVGTTNLTVDDALQASLDEQAGAGTNAVVQPLIAANATRLEMDIQREKGTVDYKFTPGGKWEFTVNYTNEKREGLLPQSLNWNEGGGFPTNPQYVPVPINDRTQNLTLGAQYLNSTRWGNWVEKLQFFASWYDNSLVALNAENPWCDGGAVGTGVNCTRDLRLALPPDNEAISFTLSGVMDLPWKSRLMRTLQYTKMEQNDPFVETNNNGIIHSLWPATSAHAEIETFLSDNTLTTRISDKLTSKLRYRYYDVDNNTPELTWDDYIRADSALVATERRNLAIDYTKQNASAALNGRVTKRVNVGASFDWERIARDRQEVNETDEYTGKIYGTARIGEATTARASVAYSERRYDKYDLTTFVGVPGGGDSQNPPEWRKYFVDNRDRLKVVGSLDIPVTDTLTVTPTLGIDRNRFPGAPDRLGVKERDGWNIGMDVVKRVNSRVSIFGGYNYEDWDWTIDRTSTVTHFINQHYQTFHTGLDLQAIPDRLAFKFKYRLALSDEDQAQEFPTGRNQFQRFSAEAVYDVTRARHYGSLKDAPPVDDTGSMVFKLGYVFEKNDTENSAIDFLQPYDSTVDNDGLFLAAYNPNYTAHIIRLSLGTKW